MRCQTSLRIAALRLVLIPELVKQSLSIAPISLIILIEDINEMIIHKARNKGGRRAWHWLNATPIWDPKLEWEIQDQFRAWWSRQRWRSLSRLEQSCVKDLWYGLQKATGLNRKQRATKRLSTRRWFFVTVSSSMIKSFVDRCVFSFSFPSSTPQSLINTVF